MKITEKDLKLISKMRKDSKSKITEIAKELSIPASTVYDKVNSLHKNNLIKRQTILVNHNKLGFVSHTFVAFKFNDDKRQEGKELLNNHPNVNSLYRISLDYDILAECIFKGHSKLYDFIDELKDEDLIAQHKIFNVIDEIKHEEFLQDVEFLS